MKKWKIGIILSTIGIFSLMNPVQAQEGNGNKMHFINVSPTNLVSDAHYFYREGVNIDYLNVMTERVMRH